MLTSSKLKKSEAKFNRKTWKQGNSKRVWIRPMHSASVTFLRQEDKHEEIIKKIIIIFQFAFLRVELNVAYRYLLQELE